MPLKVVDIIRKERKVLSSSWTQRFVESSHTVHVLSVLCLLLLSDTGDVVSRDLSVLCTLKGGESHGFHHHLVKVVWIVWYVHLHFVLPAGLCRRSRRASYAIGFSAGFSVSAVFCIRAIKSASPGG